MNNSIILTGNCQQVDIVATIVSALYFSIVSILLIIENYLLFSNHIICILSKNRAVSWLTLNLVSIKYDCYT